MTTPVSLGVNDASWDGHYLDGAIPGLLSSAHLGLVRYPGGSWADEYDWQTNTVGGQANPVDFGPVLQRYPAGTRRVLRDGELRVRHPRPRPRPG